MAKEGRTGPKLVVEQEVRDAFYRVWKDNITDEDLLDGWAAAASTIENHLRWRFSALMESRKAKLTAEYIQSAARNHYPPLELGKEEAEQFFQRHREGIMLLAIGAVGWANIRSYISMLFRKDGYDKRCFGGGPYEGSCRERGFVWHEEADPLSHFPARWLCQYHAEGMEKERVRQAPHASS